MFKRPPQFVVASQSGRTKCINTTLSSISSSTTPVRVRQSRLSYKSSIASIASIASSVRVFQLQPCIVQSNGIASKLHHSIGSKRNNFARQCSFYSSTSNVKSRGGTIQSAVVSFQDKIKLTGYDVWDRVTTGSFITAPINPVMNDIEQITNHPGTFKGEELIITPSFHKIEARHFVSASEEVTTLMQQNVNAFKENHDNIEKSNNLDDVMLQDLYWMKLPSLYLQRMMVLYMMLKNDNKGEMNRIFNTVQKLMTDASTNLMFQMTPYLLEAHKIATQKVRNEEHREDSDLLNEKLHALNWILRENNIIPHEEDSTNTKTTSTTHDDDDDPNMSLVELDRQLQSVSDELRIVLATGPKPDPKRTLPLLYNVLSLKKQKANAAGFDNYADYYLSRYMMIPNKAYIENVLDDIAANAKVIAEQNKDEWKKEDQQRMKDLKAKSLSGIDLTLPEYRPTVWGSMALHLTLESVLVGLFQLCNKLLNVDILELTEDEKPSTWIDDVKVFQVKDSKNGDLLGRIYFDPYKRPYSKPPGNNFCFPLIGRGTMSNPSSSQSNTMSTKPIVCISCDITPPDWETSPAFMSFDEVNHLFHEFGHSLHNILSKDKYCEITGTTLGMEVDAVECPSQFLSHWLYDKETLYSFAKHYRTGEPLPDEMYEELLVERSRRAADSILRRIYEYQLELTLHSSAFDPNGSQSILDVQKDTYEKYLSHDIEEFTMGDLSTFALIFGTDHGEPEFRYRYLWSEIMSLDAYEAFQEREGGSNNEDDEHKKTMNQQLGQDFRKQILEASGGVSFSKSFTKFRGRDPSTESFLRWYKLKN